MSKNRIIPASEVLEDLAKIIKKYNLDGLYAEAIAKDKIEKESLYPRLLMTSIVDDSGLHDPKDWFQDSTDERKIDGT